MHICAVLCLICVCVHQPGQVINQTRRSIDFDPRDPLCDPAQRRTEPIHPAFIVIGRCVVEVDRRVHSMSRLSGCTPHHDR